MSAIKRSFSIPVDISQALDEVIPIQERSAFVAHSHSEALRKVKKDKLIEAIDNIETWDSGGESTVDILRKIRMRNS
jgi:hypothetical protein